MSNQMSGSIHLASIVEKILLLVFGSERQQRAKLSVFVGAGVSREYGMPTTLEFARIFFGDLVSGLDDETRQTIHSGETEEELLRFVTEYKQKLDSDLAYSFFKKVEEDHVRACRTEQVLTYDRLIDLWKNGYIKLLITTNFDSLIEDRIESYNRGFGNGRFQITTLDYHDLAHGERPYLTDNALLVKIAGQIERSNMLWTDEEFKEKLSEPVIAWLAGQIVGTPVILLGYRAAEEPMANLLAQHELYMVSVAPQRLEEIKSLTDLSQRRRNGLDHVESTASQFVDRLYERLYEHTKDSNLFLSYGALEDRIQQLNTERLSHTFDRVPRSNLERSLLSFASSTDPSNRCCLMLGESGLGKTTELRKFSETKRNDVLTVYIPASEIVGDIDKWFSRLDGSSVNYVCRLTRILSRKLIIIIDGVNEVSSPEAARALLNDVIRILDLYADGHVRVILSCRNDYWSRLKFDFRRNYIGSLIEMEPFSDVELNEGIARLDAANALRRPRWSYLRELLRIPENFTFFVRLEYNKNLWGSEIDLFGSILSQRLKSMEGSTRGLIWLCREMQRSRRLSCSLINVNVESSLRNVLQDLSDAGILRINRFDVVRFAEDRMGEFTYGTLYLHEYIWQGAEQEANEIVSVFQSIVADFQSISLNYLDFKTHVLNALLFFVGKCRNDEIVDMYSAGTPFDRTLIRAAVLSRRSIGVHQELADDPVLMAVAVLDRSNFRPLLELMLQRDQKFFTAIPFNFASKLFPENFLDFIEFLMEFIKDNKIRLEEDRAYTGLLVNSLLIFLLRNGPKSFLARPSLVKRCKSLLAETSSSFLAARLAEALEENSRYLFHYHPSDKLSDLFCLDWYWRDRLLCALRGSLFDLEMHDIVGLVHQNSAVRLVLKFIFCRDFKDHRFVGLLDEVFCRDDLRMQDSCLGALGWASKLDQDFLPISERYLLQMGRDSPQNFYKESVDDRESKDSQYDPLVPHITSLLMLGREVDLTVLVPDSGVEAARRVGRLGQKTILDFPDETLRYLYQFVGEGEIDDEIQTALRAGARFSPASFWRIARQHRPSALFEISGDEIEEITRIVAQVRDFDWFQTLSFFATVGSRQKRMGKFLTELVASDSLEDFLRSTFEDLKRAG